MLKKADHFQSGESFIDDNCTWQIIMHCEDGGKFTKIELDTLNYILTILIFLQQCENNLGLYYFYVIP